ncbi:extended synaptotagmin-2-A-like isoform X1 [Erpetoichthys calabaricus]|uniref:extended synaptotagmin-2-A-like isoform X1 n=1 Tax=Erpetoichthys calabaricus TaxID=27687 RepID=UPI0022342954|nr:extended synaptotagmin-2-A-like isoform X1 [Erpetoichthys calabaricus]
MDSFIVLMFFVIIVGAVVGKLSNFWGPYQHLMCTKEKRLLKENLEKKDAELRGLRRHFRRFSKAVKKFDEIKTWSDMVVSELTELHNDISEIVTGAPNENSHDVRAHRYIAKFDAFGVGMDLLKVKVVNLREETEHLHKELSDLLREKLMLSVKEPTGKVSKNSSEEKKAEEPVPRQEEKTPGLEGPLETQTTLNATEPEIQKPSTASRCQALLHIVCPLWVVYVIGYFGCSFLWVIVVVIVKLQYSWRKEDREQQQQQALQDENLSDGQPSWVAVPDLEKSKWFNKILKQAWPSSCRYLEKMIVDSVTSHLTDNKFLKMLRFTRFSLGDKPPHVIGVKGYNPNKDQVILDLYLSYVANIDAKLEIPGVMSAGAKAIQFQAILRVFMNFIGHLPILRGMSISFVKKPKLDIDWTGITNVLDMPLFNTYFEEQIMDLIAQYYLLPKRYALYLAQGVTEEELMGPALEVILRIHLLEAQDLIAKDNLMRGLIKGKSDPYAKIQVANQYFKSRVIDNNLSPKWNEVYEATIYDVEDENLEIDIFDKDLNKDDFIGRMSISLEEIKERKVIDQWFKLENVPSGQLHLQLEWLTKPAES